ncbi:hypothetical protein CAter10_2520 [Collimonas arenae]|nr:hypothetical protein CAter10_2520 [Collimonas arenae]
MPALLPALFFPPVPVLAPAWARLFRLRAHHRAQIVALQLIAWEILRAAFRAMPVWVRALFVKFDFDMRRLKTTFWADAPPKHFACHMKPLLREPVSPRQLESDGAL